jgi:hypothetical protein
MTPQEKAKDRRLRRIYGITLAEYKKLLAVQSGVCFICGRAPAATALHVDHKHLVRDKRRPGLAKRPMVRGLLCWRCNRGLAVYRDDPALFARAAEYLTNPPARKVIR